MRLRTPLGQPCEWRDYKAVNLHEWGVAAFFRDNARLVEWVNQQPLANPLVSLGDGHDGVWNLFALIGPTTFRLEILEYWYHLMENRRNCRRVLSATGTSKSPPLVWQGRSGPQRI